MKEGLEPEKHRIYEERLELTNTGFMKEGDPNKHRIYEGRTRS